MRFVPISLVALSLTGCVFVANPGPIASSPRIRVTPMGTDQYMVSCVDSDVTSATVNPADSGHTNVIIKCRAAAQ